MRPDHVVYILTFLSAVVVVLTRLRLSQRGAAGQHQVGMGAVNAHTARGVLAHAGLLVGVLGFTWSFATQS